MFQCAPLHPQEELRLAALDRLQILDSLPEQTYQDIVELAAEICGTPVALISLVDRERQWFKAGVGIDAKETPRDVSFCAHTILGPDVFEVSDARRDTRFAANPLVVGGPKVIFYAGAPLLSPDNLPIGTICVIDSESRKLSGSMRLCLERLSRQVTALLELRTELQHISSLNKELGFYKSAVQNMGDGVLLLDEQGMVNGFNPRLLDIIQADSNESKVVLASFADFRSKCRINDPSASFDMQRQTEPVLPSCDPWTGTLGSHFVPFRLDECVVQTPNGEVWYQIRSDSVLSESNAVSGTVMLFRDVTAERNNQARLVQASRLAVLSEVSEEIIQGMNTPLALVSAIADSLLVSLGQGGHSGVQAIQGPNLSQKVRKIQETVLVIGEIVRNARSLVALQGDQDPKHVALGVAAFDCCSLLGERFRSSGMVLKFEVEERPSIFCSAVDLGMLIISILDHAHCLLLNKMDPQVVVRIDADESTAKLSCMINWRAAGHSQLEGKHWGPSIGDSPVQNSMFSTELIDSTVRRIGGTLEFIHGIASSGLVVTFQRSSDFKRRGSRAA
jgi:PAS domain-containing protein